MMSSRTLRKEVFLITAMISAGLYFLIMWNSAGKCIFCQTEKDVLFFKRESGHFLLLPHCNCHRNSPFLVTLVTSYPTHLEVRAMIRETWGKKNLIPNKHVVTYFLLGTTLNPEEQVAVANESLKYGDIIQKNFTDSYYNLTLKTMMGIEWIHKFCPQSSFVMKTDSDVFVNIYYLTELLKRKRKTRFFTGFVKPNEHPIRNKSSKWYVSKEEYPGNTYPSFCSGTGYVFSSDVASQVYDISISIPFVKLEDVFIGLCLAKLNIKPENLNSKQTFFPEKLKFSPCRFRTIVTSHSVKPQELLLYWKALERSKDEKCPYS